MKKRSIALIIGLMSFALLGVVGMQLYFLRQSYQMQSALFDRDVNEALSNVVNKISKRDANNFLNDKARGSFSGQIKDNPIKIIDNNSLSKTSLKHKLTGREKKIALLRDSLKNM